MKPIPCALTALFLAAPAFLGAAHALDNNGSGPTVEQIYCKNKAVDNYWAQMKACEQNLSDIPDQLAQCQSDAAADLRRNQSACTAASRGGGSRPVFHGGGVIEQVR